MLSCDYSAHGLSLSEEGELQIANRHCDSELLALVQGLLDCWQVPVSAATAFSGYPRTA